MTGYFLQAFIYLLAAVIAVPIAKKLGLGSVLGYLIAGVFIGPIIGLVGSETETIQHFAEFGVVVMLFLVGLELEPKMLWAMRTRLVGLGGLQVILSTLIIMSLSMVLGVSWTIALTIGLVLTSSSTAIVLQTLNEKALNKTEGGRASFAVLLFQDIAVIPMLALIPLLAAADISLVAGLHGWIYALVVVSSIVVVVVGGHYLSRPLFRFVARSGLREIFVATALMLVIGIAALMSLVGLSPALGTFLAGVVLANSEFKHELESNLEPFKGLLLGLFFITVGAGINFGLLFGDFATIIGLTLGVMLVKALVLLLLTYIFKIRGRDRWLFALSLAQAGEFGFVLLSYTVQSYVLPTDLAQTLSLVVALSMFLTPGLFILFDKLVLPRFQEAKNKQEADEIDEQGSVLIAGSGRFGQVVNRLLIANGIKAIALDHEVNQIENMRAIGVKSFFGDATRPDLLHTAGIADSKVMVVAIDNKERAIELVEYVKKNYPLVRVLARAYDRGHHYELRRAGADYVISETYYSALDLGAQVLMDIGIHPFKVERLKTAFVETEAEGKESLYQAWKDDEEENKFSNSYRKIFLEVEKALGEAMNRDRNDKRSRSERGWTPPPKNYIDDFK
ncbi:UNVERIFIED_CONTAM: hypothetical protein GTU68_060386 [Idotea baltica]|nr:hypothetical protein [Idotea baltica]